MDNLLPCPFCGSSKIEFRDIAQQTLVAVCCGCNAEGGYTTLAAGSTSRDEAAEFWNTRSEGLPPPGGGGGLMDIFERSFDHDDPRIRVAQCITRAEAEAILEHRGDMIAALLPPSPGEREAVARRIADGFWHGNLNWEELTESQRDACMSAAEAVLISPSNPGKEGQ